MLSLEYGLNCPYFKQARVYETIIYDFYDDDYFDELADVEGEFDYKGYHESFMIIPIKSIVFCFYPKTVYTSNVFNVKLFAPPFVRFFA